MKSLTAALLAGEPTAIKIFGHDLSHETLLLRARMMQSAPTDPNVIEALRAYDALLPKDAARADSLLAVAQGAVVICAGQQPGLLSGPLMALAKAAAAQRLAEQLKADGIPAVALFWIASEDHDFAEANRFFKRTTDENLEASFVHLADRETKPSLHHLQFSEQDHDQLKTLQEELGFDPAYLPTTTENFGSWYARLLAQLTAGSGLLILEPIALAQELKDFRREVISRALELSEVMSFASAAIREQGFLTPLEDLPSFSTLTFFATDAGRQRLDLQFGGYRAGEFSINPHELEELLAQQPELFTSAAAARPLAQSAVLPVVAQVSGPTESAYMAQLMPLFQSLGLPCPLIYPRPSLQVLDDQLRDLQETAGLTGPIATWFRSEGKPEATESPDLERIIQAIKAALDQVENLQDPFLRTELVSYRRNAMHQLRQLTKSWKKAQKKRNPAVVQSLHRLEQELRPKQGGQDRVLSACALGLPLTGDFFAMIVRNLTYPLPRSLELELGEAT